MKPSDRMKIARQTMPEQEADERRGNFIEVNQGLPGEAARQEAERCLQCHKKNCVAGCPVGIDIRMSRPETRGDHATRDGAIHDASRSGGRKRAAHW